jgi:hypothetical protein
VSRLQSTALPTFIKIIASQTALPRGARNRAV